MVKISAQLEHFSVLVLKVSHSKFWLLKPIFRHLDPESGSGFRIRIPNTDPDPGSRLKLNADPTGSGFGSGFGSGSETLPGRIKIGPVRMTSAQQLPYL